MECIAPLFVPADRPERFAKAAASGADAVILDLEDAVAPDRKEIARAALDASFTALPVIVRVNAPGSPWHETDLAAATALKIHAIMLPKAEANPGLSQACTAAMKAGIRVIALVESARGLADAREIAATQGVFRLAFGSIDYCADLGCEHTREALLAARSELVLASRLAGLTPPIDGVTTAIDQPALVTDDARHARSLGFMGKLCIHPKQVAPAIEGFMPSPTDITWAERILASGEGAVAVDGAMVDEPVRLRARSILARAASRPAA
ncbi:MAG: CoA ester lyase [Beijerinckiaceae bacterium]|jgi:citrate lyase subunit beta/citryl-CoA lyase|nr:CoA ester lyase [Beijerinckiaceae bacterium]